MVANTVVKPNKQRKFPILIVNNTNRTIKLKKGCVVGKAELVYEQNMVTVKDKIQATTGPTNQVDSINKVNAPEEHKQTITKLVKKNRDLFAAKDSDLGHTDTVKMKINTGENPPIKLRPYRTPLNNRKIVDQAIDEMLEAKIISRSKSPWSFPVVIVDKKDGSKRFCVDFRKLNKVTKLNSYPLPLIDDMLALLGNAKYFTSLDLKSGYWQVLMEEEDKEKTVLLAIGGYLNLMSCLLVYQMHQQYFKLMSIVLQDLDKFAVAYSDDIFDLFIILN